MTTYAPDPDAEAVVLCRLTDVEYSVQTDGYLVDYHEKIRIKVLKPEGAKYAQVTIPYYVVPQDKHKLYTSQLQLRTQPPEFTEAATQDAGES